jgi:predicted metalloprotease with PDZ domain
MNPVVVRITAGSPASQAGLALGDRVAAIDGTDILSQADMVARLAAAGNRVAVDVDRKGRCVRLEMTRGDINASDR